MEYILIGIGGGLGACSRYILTKIISKKHTLPMPIETLIINVLGSFLLGVSSALMKDHFQILLVQTGFMGGFTTFSTFMVESFKILKYKEKIYSLIYILLSLILGVIAYAIGFMLF